MLVYEGTKLDFSNSVKRGTIADEVELCLLERLGRHTARAEINSWTHSLQSMNAVLSDMGIPDDVGVAIEYNIPQTSKRVDFIISGYDKAGKPNAIVIELKQWTEIEAVDGLDALVRTFTGGIRQTVVHPSYQAWSYAALIQEYI